MITVRLLKNVFNGDFEVFKLEGPAYISSLKSEKKLADAEFFRDGKLLDDKDIIEDDDFIIAQIIPRDPLSTMAVITAVLVFTAAVSAGILISALASIPTVKKLQTNPSLRGSTNSARKNEALPILLGRHRVYPDVAALPYTLYKDDDQYLRQLFSFGYSPVSIDRSTVKIGETLLTKYTGYTLADNFEELYNERCIESSISVELKNDGSPSPIERTTASGTWKICIGIIAPSGIRDASVDIKIEWRETGTDAWTTSHEDTLKGDVDKLRRMYTITPPSPGTFDVRISRTNKESDDASVIDMVYIDIIQSWTETEDGNRKPVNGAERFSLLSLELKATDQLNGIVDELNAVCTLRARIYKGTGTGPDAWEEGDALNPSAAILYLLTDTSANPDALTDDEIVWSDFEDFYLFCEDHGFECNAYISSQDYSIDDICSYIAESNLAQIRKVGRKIGILIDAAVSHVTQLFTPRNAWGFSIQKSFSHDIRYFRIKYVDASLGYEETERTVSLSPDGTIVFDAEIPEDETGTEISLLGVTDPEHAAYVGRQRLREISWRRRTFTWTSDVEGIMCLPGDVVLLEHDQFSIGLGEGRVKKIVEDDEGIMTGIVLDTSLPFEDTKVYSVIIRSGSTISESLTITAAEDGCTLTFRATPMGVIRVGDLVVVGEYSKEAVKLMISSIERGDDSSCRITAVDYDEAIYEEGEIPPYDPGISRYPDAGDIGTGAHLPDGYVPPSRPGADGGDPLSLFQYSASPVIPPDDSSSLIVWGGTVIAWGSTAFSLDLGEWSPEIPDTPPEGKPYLWEKYWSYTLGEWQIFCRISAPSPDFDITCVPQTFRLTSRGYTKGEQTIRAICRRRNTTSPVIWTIPSSLSWHYPVESETHTIDITIPEHIELSSFSIVCYVEAVDTKEYVVTGVPEGVAEPVYGGVYPEGSLPADTSEGDLMIGDHITVEGADGTRTPYYWAGEEKGWVIADENTPVSIAWMIQQDTAYDVLKSPSTLVSQSIINLYAANFATLTGFAYNFKARRLLVGDGNGTAGSGLEVEIADYADGVKLERPIFRVRFGADTVFQIDPLTGCIFFGQPKSDLSGPESGFMYRPPQDGEEGGSIRSKDDKIIIRADGTLRTEDSVVSGRIITAAIDAGPSEHETMEYVVTSGWWGDPNMAKEIYELIASSSFASRIQDGYIRCQFYAGYVLNAVYAKVYHSGSIYGVDFFTGKFEKIPDSYYGGSLAYSGTRTYTLLTDTSNSDHYAYFSFMSEEIIQFFPGAELVLNLPGSPSDSLPSWIGHKQLYLDENGFLRMRFLDKNGNL